MRNEGRAQLGSVDRALQLVLLLRTGEVLSVSSAAARLQIAPSTAHRLLTALVRRGFATQGADRRYRAGPETTSGVMPAVALPRLKAAASPVMHDVSAQVQETVQLVVLDGQHVHYLHGVEPDRALKISAAIDQALPAHCSGGGKAMLADLSADDLDRVYARDFPASVNPLISTYEELAGHLVKVRTDGYGTTFDEHEDGISGVGVAIRDSDGRSMGAITVAVPTTRFVEEAIPAWVRALRKASLEISARLE
ncbi:IclR family transcriptional regulator [Georgenia halophila]|uniref:IclR family transcriptional regulator n=1 Tax=Georgenia halophila TaxID=620889 RepID=A0ABP8KT68_9MICO